MIQRSTANPSQKITAIKLETPPVITPADAEVDIEVLKSVPKQFAIDCEEHANWLVKKVVSARAYAERVKVWAEQELRRAQREEMTLLFLFGRQIEAWAKTEIEQFNGRRKSLNLPAGIIGFRTITPSLQVDDEQVVLIWAKENYPTAVVVVEKLSRAELTTVFEKTGEVPDTGAHVDPGGEKFFIR